MKKKKNKIVKIDKQKDLTFKQRKWISIYIDTGNATEAAMQVYKCKNREVARSIGSENLAKLDYSDFMEVAGITDALLQQKIMEGLNAQRVISANVVVKSDDPKVKNKTATARDVDFIDVPDYMARHKYLETALKLKKRLNDKSEDTPTNTTTVIGFKFVFPTKPNESD